jgi:hypothetical protein
MRLKIDSTKYWTLFKLHNKNFNFQKEKCFEKTKKKDFFTGKNVYGIARAYRAANIESIVLSAPLYYEDKTHTDKAKQVQSNPFGIAQMLVLAKLVRS